MSNTTLLPNFREPEVDTRRWGKEIIFANNSEFCGKILHMEAGNQLSMHFHSIAKFAVPVAAVGAAVQYGAQQIGGAGMMEASALAAKVVGSVGLIGFGAHLMGSAMKNKEAHKLDPKFAESAQALGDRLEYLKNNPSAREPIASQEWMGFRKEAKRMLVGLGPAALADDSK
jgi:hypothetical protein